MVLCQRKGNLFSWPLSKTKTKARREQKRGLCEWQVGPICSTPFLKGSGASWEGYLDSKQSPW